MAWEKRLLGAVLAFLVSAATVPAFAIDIAIGTGATMQVEGGNVIAISPVTIGSNPYVPAGTYTVRFQWDSRANALVPISATAVGGGGGSTGRHVGQELNGVVIEAESLTTSPYGPGCRLQLRVRNRTGQLKSFGFFFNAFDAAGTGIGFTLASGLISANGSANLEGIWATSSSTALTCGQIARYDLDLSVSYAYP